MVYWAIATSSKYPDVYVERIKAQSDGEASEKAEKWHKENMGFRYSFVVAKEISKSVLDTANNACLECGSDLSGGFHGDGCSFNGFYKPYSKIDVSKKDGQK
ncbi:hypothetical protein A3G55_00100 [Candidatus Giovannonibacteria bacterium RIFCSPLOWO2_12_FULL_44_25]|uniref:Uncharacterized protein n=4 Tax=Parcubacteria group TaxID=1794811 RepID=A0A837IQX6_9BACT|nr:MAG: hypothetical protein UW15_C0013G0018 [Parcubacteria group bacterium GW2011_GWC1_44_10]KKT57330.1 MAG: hypothetical protein UW49_C0005G0018 [Candidatus Giovannonibacteria bacterium GW2011_GWB1_44_23]KKT59678.1 MAG: hypothetical protein UW53_C0009G0018 [Candidatus Giovannonibacteria bacterium GW2011_GWA1_44_25]KKU12990.1 MAG: hypothetical protein UX18_C0004G0006 [Candidatus Azambacteria bacterium GW2011_GWC2_45_7b]OGF50055.1 MAG: hypothetical protein A2120_02910 [Candidatus Giovannonibact